MSLIIEGPIPPRWQRLKSAQGRISLERYLRREEGLSLAFINNMPDSALEDTELQFFELLDAASGHTPIFLKLFSLTGVPRGGDGQRHVDQFYFELSQLWSQRFDGVIITGTEPQQSDLRNEPYWDVLAAVFDWASENTASSILSCLAAHASVLHFDGVPRHRMNTKRFGLFPAQGRQPHPLLRNLPDETRFPHSRWNELLVPELASCGYEVLTESPIAGADVFTKQINRSLMLHFQGHPEYGAQTLLKEYRRDIKRFLRGERETYPEQPHGYFSAQAASSLERFQQRALDDRREEIIAQFPESAIAALENVWQPEAIGIYREWIAYLFAAREETRPTVVAMPQAHSVDAQPRTKARGRSV